MICYEFGDNDQHDDIDDAPKDILYQVDNLLLLRSDLGIFIVSLGEGEGDDSQDDQCDDETDAVRFFEVLDELYLEGEIEVDCNGDCGDEDSISEIEDELVDYLESALRERVYCCLVESNAQLEVLLVRSDVVKDDILAFLDHGQQYKIIKRFTK